MRQTSAVFASFALLLAFREYYYLPGCGRSVLPQDDRRRPFLLLVFFFIVVVIIIVLCELVSPGLGIETDLA